MVGRSRAAYEFATDMLLAFELRDLIRRVGRRSDLEERLVAVAPQLAAAGGTLSHGDPDRLDIMTVADDLVWEMTFCRMVDSFTTYLSETLYLIALAQPELIDEAGGQSGETLRARVDRRVDRLCRGSSDRMLTFLSRTAGVDPFVDDVHSRGVAFWVSVRNLFVHHRGRVHERFAAHWQLSPEVIGTAFRLSDDLLSKASSDLLAACTRIDHKAVADFGVQPFSE